MTSEATAKFGNGRTWQFSVFSIFVARVTYRVGRTAGRYRDVSQAEEWIKKYLSNPEAFNFMIELNDSELDGHSEPKPIGSIGTPRTPEVEPHQKIVREIGFLLTPTAWGKGYATEAARAIVKAIFEKTEVTHVVARTDEENQGSWNALQKVGFRRVDRKEYENVSLGKRIFLYYEIARPGYAIKGEEVKDTKDA